MSLSARSPEDIINLSLVRIGYRGRVANLFEGSAAANDALAIYGQTRDELLRQGDWDFAEVTASLTLLKSAPEGGYIPGVTPWSTAYPPLPWLFEYQKPDDCLKIRAVKPVPLFLPVMDPQPHVFSLGYDDTLAPPAQVILCNVPDAVLTYTGQPTNPLTWEADFIEALAAALARRIAPNLVGWEAAKLLVIDEKASLMVAETEQG